MKLEYIKTSSDKYIYLKQVLREEFALSSRLILKLKKDKKIFVNNQFTYLDRILNNNDKISVVIDFNEDNSNILATKGKLDILYEDEYLLIVNKPAKMPVHPSASHYTDSLCNIVKYYFDINNINRKIRPVNRLDRNTSGIVIFAKNEYIQECLIKQMSHKQIKKEYIAICIGGFDKKEGYIDAPISRKQESIIERCVNKNGDQAITKYYVLQQNNNFAKLQINLLTGRTNQIRVHMSYIGHPIIGDDLYGTKSNLINRQALHAFHISFLHPINKNKISINSPIPEDMQKLLHFMQ